jgi:hypothetical protein
MIMGRQERNVRRFDLDMNEDVCGLFVWSEKVYERLSELA